MKIYLIRHSITEGNLKRRYIGKTNESLCAEGERLLRERAKKGVYPKADKIFTSPMKRCIQTAQILYPKQTPVVVDELSECDFGRFENKSYEELKALPEYQMWLDGGGMAGFPDGESRIAFSERCLEGFIKALKMCGRSETAAFIIHGGTIMSIMERYAFPKGEYYDFQIGNGEGYELILADVLSDYGGLYSGFDAGRPGVAVSSGENDRPFDCVAGKNYKRLPA